MAISIVLFSCSKPVTEVDDVQPASASRLAGEAVSRLDYANDHNPFEHAGQRHNEILEALESHIWKTRDTSRQAKRSFVISYCMEQGMDITRSVARTEKIMKQVRPDNYDIVIQHPRMTGHLSESLASVMEQIGTLEGDETFTGFVESMKAREQEVIDAADIPEEEKAAILTSMAIARHSAGFWYERRQNFMDAADSGRRLPGWVNWIVRMQAAITVDYLSAFVSVLTLGGSPSEDAAMHSGFVHDGIKTYW